MSAKTKTQLVAATAAKIKSGSNPSITQAHDVRELLGDVYDSVPNIKDAGFIFEAELGYVSSWSGTPSTDYAFTHKKYVVDLVTPALIRVYEAAYDAVLNADLALYNRFSLTAMSGATIVSPPTGTPYNFQEIIYSFYSGGTARAVTFDPNPNGFFAANVALPTTTVINQYLQVVARWNKTVGKWGVVAVNSSAGGGGTYTDDGTTIAISGSNVVSVNSTYAATLLTLTGAQAVSNKTGNISQWTNNSGYLTANQTITLSGDASGSGTTGIAVTIGAGKVTNTMLAGSIDLTTKVTGILPGANGGNGVNNSTRTITIAGNFETTGAFNTTLAQQFSGVVTLPPAVSTLATLALSETLTNKIISSGSTYNAGNVTSNGTITGVKLVIQGGSSYGGYISSSDTALMINSTNDIAQIGIGTGAGTARGFLGASSTNCFHVWNSSAGAMQISVNNSTGDFNVRVGKTYLGGTSVPSEVLEVAGNTKSNHIIGRTSTPTITAGAGAGTTPTVSVTGNDISGVVTVTTGTLPTLSAIIATVTFNVPYGSVPNVILTAANSNAATLSGANMVFVNSAGIAVTTFDITAGATALLAATTYKWYYTSFQ